MAPRRPTGHELDAPPWSRVEGTLLSTARLLRRVYDAALAYAGLSLPQASTLAHLQDHGALTQSALARRVGTGRARAGSIVDELVAIGAVERHADPDDRRIWSVVLTPHGESLYEKVSEIDRLVRAGLRSGIGPEDRARLDEILIRVSANATALLTEDWMDGQHQLKEAEEPPPYRERSDGRALD